MLHIYDLPLSVSLSFSLSLCLASLYDKTFDQCLSVALRIKIEPYGPYKRLQRHLWL